MRLVGSDADVLAVAHEAVRVLSSRRDLRRAVYPQLADLQRSRRAVLAAGPAPAKRGPDDRWDSTPWRVVWGAVLTVGLGAATTSAAMLGPSGRKSRYVEPDVAILVAMPALWTAVVALVVLLLVPVPRGEAARVGTTTTLVVSILLAAVLGLRLAVGSDDRRGFTDAQVVPWILGAVALLVLCAALMWRLDRARRRADRDGPRTGGHRAARDQDRRLHERAERLAALGPGPDGAALDREWAGRLDRLAKRGVHPDTLAQARALTPVAWLTWACYDGDLDPLGLVPQRLRST